MVPVVTPDSSMLEDSFQMSSMSQEDTKDSVHMALMKSAENMPAVRTSARLKAKGSAYSNAYASAGISSSNNTPNPETESINSVDSDSVFHKLHLKVIDREETESDVDIMDIVSDDQNHSNIEKKQLQNVENSDVKFHISFKDEKDDSCLPTTIASTDITRPLLIQTKFGNLPPGPGTGSSTDTASEIGSCLSSPVCSIGHQSPDVGSIKVEARLLDKIKKESPDCKKQLYLKVEHEEVVKSEVKKEVGVCLGGEVGENVSPETCKKKRRKFVNHHQGFTPKVFFLHA